jgi:hypothetical protein
VVHGWLELPIEGQFPGQRCETGIQRFDETNSTLGDIPDWFEDLDYEVWIAHWTTGFLTGTPSIESNAINCLEPQLRQIAALNHNPMALIAHSTGGLISRKAIRDLVDEVDIRALYTVGSPHAGVPVPLLEIMLAGNVPPEKLRDAIHGVCNYDTSGCEMDKHTVILFNGNNPNLPGVDYTFIGGNAWGGTAGYISQLRFGPSDGFVQKYSAVGWSLALKSLGYVGFIPTDWVKDSPPTQFWTDEFHANGMGGNSDDHNYYSPRATGTPSHAFECIWAGIQGNSTPDPDHCEPATLDHWREDFGISDGSPPNIDNQYMDLQTGYLDPNQSASMPVVVDSNGDSVFQLAWNGDAAPAFTLTRSDNQVIDPAYAAAHPDEVTYQTTDSGPILPAMIIYTIHNTQPGNWQLNVQAGSQPAGYLASGVLETSRILTVQTDAVAYQVGDSATISARLENDGAGIRGATVTALLNRADGVVDTINLADQGDGSYTAVYTVPAAPGFAMLEVTVNGNDNGVDFSRQQSLDRDAQRPAVDWHLQ